MCPCGSELEAPREDQRSGMAPLGEASELQGAHSWGSLSRVTESLGGMISRPQNLEVSSWTLVRSGHHRPRHPFRMGKLVCPSLFMETVDLVVFRSGSRGADSSSTSPWDPLSVGQGAHTRALAGTPCWHLMVSEAPGAKETRA